LLNRRSVEHRWKSRVAPSGVAVAYSVG
jgi:hypothetical protein